MIADPVRYSAISFQPKGDHMKIESTHNVMQREQDERELSSALIIDMLIEHGEISKQLKADSSFNNHTDRLARRRTAIASELAARMSKREKIGRASCRER